MILLPTEFTEVIEVHRKALQPLSHFKDKIAVTSTKPGGAGQQRKTHSIGERKRRSASILPVLHMNFIEIELNRNEQLGLTM